MKVLVTGAKGQLGLSIRDQSGGFPDLQLVYTDVEELDITSEFSLREFFSRNRIDVVVNCAAYTTVDKAETEQEKAFMINDQAVKNLAILSKEFGYFMVHISTDFVFDGTKTQPYLETDIPNPLSVYGHSKLAGEKEVLSHTQNAAIIRTSWLYSEYGNNFVKTIQRLALERKEIRVVDDQVGTPTYAGDLALVILKMISKGFGTAGCHIYHFSNTGIASWFDFAKAIIDAGNFDCKVVPIPTIEYPLPAKRPAYSVLNKEKIIKQFNLDIPDWKLSLLKCLDNMAKGC
jgi:dTDP-4-dehydrorhamnose reductase